MKKFLLDIRNGCFKDVKEKGNKIVDIIFLDNTEKLLREWLDYRESKNIASDCLFIAKSKENYVQMQQSTMGARIRKIGELIGYDKLYSHTLRKTAINLLSNLSDINFAAEYAHHNDTKVTKDYYIKASTGAENRSKILQIRQRKRIIK